VTFLDALVPDEPDSKDLVRRLREMRLRDSGQPVDLGPVDEASLRLAFTTIHSSPFDLMIEIPRGEHDLAILFGIYLQLSRKAAQAGYRSDGNLDGPVVVIGRNKHLGDRLRGIKVGTATLSEALAAQRVRGNGSVAALDGTISPAKAWSDGLFYLNTNLGWPDLGCDVSVAIIDRTSLRSMEAFTAAVTWAHEHGAWRIVVLSELADRPDEISDERSWLYWPWTPGLRSTLKEELGHRACNSTLSMNPLSAHGPPKVVAAVYSAPAIEKLRRELLYAVAVARKVKGVFPKPLADAVRLLNVLMTTWGSLQEANRWAVETSRGETALTLRRRLDTPAHQHFTGEWVAFKDTTWPDLRRGVIALYDLLQEFNPRLEMLLFLLDKYTIDRPGAPVIVRAASRSDALAVQGELLSAKPALATRVESGALRVVPDSERLPWSAQDTVEIRLGVPAPWRRSALFTGEANEIVVVVDAAERKWLELSYSSAQRIWLQSLEVIGDRLSLAGVATASREFEVSSIGPISVDDRGSDAPETHAPELAADLNLLFSQFQTALKKSESQAEQAAVSSQRLRPIVLGPQAETFLFPAEGSVDVLVGSRYRMCKVSELAAGMQIVVTLGEGRRGVYDRILGLMYESNEMATLNLLLERFRKDVWTVYDKCHQSWSAAVKLISSQGGSVGTALTVKEWATGERIGPDNSGDIKIVARIAGDTDLTRDETWRRVGEVAKEFRRLRAELGRCLSAAIREAAKGRPGENLAKLEEIAGGLDLSEVLEEFQLRAVVGVEPPEDAAGRNARFPRPIDDYAPTLT